MGIDPHEVTLRPPGPRSLPRALARNPFRPSRLLERQLASLAPPSSDELLLDDGSRVAVVGGGPAGSLFSYFVLRMSEAMGIEDLAVDIYEPRHFLHCGPAGCNHCGGIVSETLVQHLAIEGIRLPKPVIQRGIDSYMLHMDVGSVRIETPLQEKRIAAIYRGNGPRQSEPIEVLGFDRFLLELAEARGATIQRRLVDGIRFESGRPRILTPDGPGPVYDLVAIAAGINSNLLSRIEGLELGYERPKALRTFICEFHLGRETIERMLGSSMHVFLLDLPRLEFAALIPKGDFATLCMLGDEIDDDLVRTFFESPQVRERFPNAIVPPQVCHCFPRINVAAARQPFADRLVMVGDSGVTRLYKDGIGAAYRTAKAAARTAVFCGVSEAAFREHYAPACRAINFDNQVGKFIFSVSHLVQKFRFTRRGVLRMTATEQSGASANRPLSGMLWDTFTGSAPYKDIFRRTLNPLFAARLGWNLLLGNLPGSSLPSRNGGIDEA
jgi:flavin-dependent dehydrogenase